MGTIYLLCFVDEQGRHTPYRHAGHYMGWTQDLDARIEAHRAGKGARLIQVITAAGLGFVMARTWEGDRHQERALKNRKEGPRLCPICRPTSRS